MVHFEDKTNRKKKTAALLLYTQLEHGKIILQDQHHLLQVFGLFIIMLSFKQHSVFFLVEQYPLQFSTDESFINIYYKLKNSHAKDRLKYNQTVSEKFEQYCKVTDNTGMVVTFTVDVNNEIIQMKYNVPLKRDHVCTRMKLGLVQSPAYNINTVYFMDWRF